MKNIGEENPLLYLLTKRKSQWSGKMKQQSINYLRRIDYFHKVESMGMELLSLLEKVELADLPASKKLDYHDHSILVLKGQVAVFKKKSEFDAQKTLDKMKKMGPSQLHQFLKEEGKGVDLNDFRLDSQFFDLSNDSLRVEFDSWIKEGRVWHFFDEKKVKERAKKQFFESRAGKESEEPVPILKVEKKKEEASRSVTAVPVLTALADQTKEQNRFTDGLLGLGGSKTSSGSRRRGRPKENPFAKMLAASGLKKKSIMVVGNKKRRIRGRGMQKGDNRRLGIAFLTITSNFVLVTTKRTILMKWKKKDLENYYLKQAENDYRNKVAHLSKIFYSTPRNDIEKLMHLVSWLELPKGNVIFKEGDTMDCFHIVWKGDVEVSS